MPAGGWYQDNRFRDYPFLFRERPVSGGPGFTELPRPVVVDFGAVLDLDSGFRPETDSVYLQRISRQGTQFRFTFRTTAAGALESRLEFLRSLGTTDAVSYEDAVWDEEPMTAACDGSPPWWGFLVTGDLEPLTEMVSDGGFVTFDPSLWVVEPAQLRSLAGSYVRSISLANFPRVVVSAPDGCEDSSGETIGSRELIPSALCLQGPLSLKEGYNCAIRRDPSDNAFIISPIAGAGAGQVCDEVPLFSTESPPGDSPFLSGGPGCGQTLKTINGVGGRNIVISGGPGVRVRSDPSTPHGLIVDRALDGFAICTRDPLPGESSGSSGASSG